MEWSKIGLAMYGSVREVKGVEHGECVERSEPRWGRGRAEGRKQRCGMKKEHEVVVTHRGEVYFRDLYVCIYIFMLARSGWREREKAK